jgi:hypothetical protein
MRPAGLRLSENFAQVLPLGVFGFDERDPFIPSPALDLLFAGDGDFGVAVGLEPNQFVDVVFLGKAGDFSAFVLQDAAEEIVGHSGVESAGIASENVNVIGAVLAHGGL